MSTRGLGEGRRRSSDVAKGSSTMSEIDAWLAHAVVTESAEAIVVTDPDGIIRLWNNGAARVFGYSAAEAAGQSLDLITRKKRRARHGKGYRERWPPGSPATGTSC